MTLPPVAVIVPWRDKGDEFRRRNQQYVVEHLRALRLGPVIISSDWRPTDEPFNRSAAYNRGIAHAPDATIYVFHEADMLLTRYRLIAAIRAAATPGLVVPFQTYWYLSRGDTERVLAGRAAQTCLPERQMRHGRSVGAVGVVSAATMQAVGCWDETFTGWGYDDRAMCRAFHICTQTATRYIPGIGHHLWHTPGWEAGGRFAGGAYRISRVELEATQRNGARWLRYQQATTPEQIRVLTAGG